MLGRCSRRSAIAPGPPGDPIFGHLRALRRDPLGFLLDARRVYGDIARLQMGPRTAHLVSRPDWIGRVLTTHQHAYRKSADYQKIESVVGKGLLTSEGDLWRRQRRLAQPAFQPDRLDLFVAPMAEATAAMLDRWEGHAASGRSLDIAPELGHLAMKIAARTLFSTDVGDEATGIGRAVTVAMQHANRRLRALFPLPEYLPTPDNLRYRRAIRALDAVVCRMIEERRRAGREGHDLVSLLPATHDQRTGEAMTDRQVRDEVMTIFLAGHETTANALAWALYLLSAYPWAQRRLEAELAEVLGGRTPEPSDLPRLAYTTMVLREAMRLYPPAWFISRTPLADDAIGGYRVPAGSTVIMSQYVVHRHPAYWDRPEAFDPERFGPERSRGRPPFAYFPFGGGPRACIGGAFAMTEARVVLAMIAQRVRLELVSQHPVEPEPLVTLRPRHGILAMVRPRKEL
jgi:cytochrome P450